jgi:hypothetical protein
MKNDTPITEYIFAGWLNSHPAKRSHAKLERELNQAIAERDELHLACLAMMKVVGEPGCSEEEAWATVDEIDAAYLQAQKAIHKLKEPKTTNVETTP